jgi:hypothetical protein
MDRSALIAEWQMVFGHLAPRGAHLNLLHGAIAWQCQVAADTTGSRESLAMALRQWSANAATAKLKSGTKLLREWKGRQYEVTVLDKGYLYNGQTYRSLTAITREITRMGWSGPLFFGLRK